MRQGGKRARPRGPRPVTRLDQVWAVRGKRGMARGWLPAGLAIVPMGERRVWGLWAKIERGGLTFGPKSIWGSFPFSFVFFFYSKAISTHFKIILNHFEF